MIVPFIETLSLDGEFKASLTVFVGAGGGCRRVLAWLMMSSGTITSAQEKTLVLLVTATPSGFLITFLKITELPSLGI